MRVVDTMVYVRKIDTSHMEKRRNDPVILTLQDDVPTSRAFGRNNFIDVFFFF